MKERKLTCIICPRGCQITVNFDGEGKIKDISGNACKRGASYAEAEITHPVRTVTSTVRCEGGGIVSVKTSRAVPKEKIFEVMEKINAHRAKEGVKIGDIIIENILGLSVDIVATSSDTKCISR